MGAEIHLDTCGRATRQPPAGGHETSYGQTQVRFAPSLCLQPLLPMLPKPLVHHPPAQAAFCKELQAEHILLLSQSRAKIQLPSEKAQVYLF